MSGASASGMGEEGVQYLSGGAGEVCQQVTFDVPIDCETLALPAGLTAYSLSLACADWLGFNVGTNLDITAQLVDPANLQHVFAEVNTGCRTINGCTAPIFSFPLMYQPTPPPTSAPGGTPQPTAAWSVYATASPDRVIPRFIIPADNITLMLWGELIAAAGTPTPTVAPTIVPWGEPRLGRDSEQGEDCHPGYMDAAGNLLDSGLRWWRIQTYDQNNNPRPTFPEMPIEPAVAHHGLQDLWVSTIFNGVYIRSLHYGRGPTLLLPEGNHFRTYRFNLLNSQAALDYSWEQMWSEDDFNRYDGTSDPANAEQDYSSAAMRMFAVASTPRHCVDLFRQRLRLFMRDLVCRAVVTGLIASMPPQVQQVKAWLETTTGESLTVTFCETVLNP